MARLATGRAEVVVLPNSGCQKVGHPIGSSARRVEFVARLAAFSEYGHRWFRDESRGVLVQSSLTISLMGGFDFREHRPREFIVL